MNAKSNSRKADRESRSSTIGAAGVDLERQDDKNSKAETADDHTVKFVMGLLVVVLLVCGGLWYLHAARTSVENIIHTSIGPPQSPQQFQPISIYNPPKVSKAKVNSQSTDAQQVTEVNKPAPLPQTLSVRFNFDGQPIPRAGASNTNSNSVFVSTPITWQGCQTSLPDPNPALEPPLDPLNKHAPYEYNRKHIVPPPAGPVKLVCCNTTKGVLNIEVHPTWAPNGAARFLHMVNSGLFSTEVGLFRALKDFLVQFGLPGDPAVLKKYHQMGNLVDDKPWLPLGPTGREINGTKRFRRGYLAYAGAGINSRGTQLIMAFQDNLYLGGGSPWEVPFAQVYGYESYQTLGQIYTKYGESPSQGKIMNQGKDYLKREFPLLDYITQCSVMNENVQWSYSHQYK
eukprot:gene17081-19472_t